MQWALSVLAGKTTVIRDIVSQLSKKEKNIVWLKNEYGEAGVDSLVASVDNIKVVEITNGCLCCILVSQLGDALVEIASMIPPPDRIIIETSGSAYPAPLAFELKNHPTILRLEAIITVIDVLNFPGYSDKSYTAKLQCKYTDLVLLNKWEMVSGSDPGRLDAVLDDVYEVCGMVPKVKTDRGHIDAGLITSLEGRDIADYGAEEAVDASHHRLDVEVLDGSFDSTLSLSQLEALLAKLPIDDVYRAKGVVRLDDGTATIFNYVFGRYSLQPLTKALPSVSSSRVTFMGSNMGRNASIIAALLGTSADGLRLM